MRQEREKPFFKFQQVNHNDHDFPVSNYLLMSNRANESPLATDIQISYQRIMKTLISLLVLSFSIILAIPNSYAQPNEDDLSNQPVVADHHSLTLVGITMASTISVMLALFVVYSSIRSSAIKKSESKTDPQKKSTKTLFYNGELMVLVRAETQEIVEVNESFLKLTKMSEQAVLGQKLHKLSGFESDTIQRILQAGIHGNTISPEETRILDGEGEEHFVELNTQSIQVAQEPLVLLVFHDITERKKNEKKIFLLSRAIEQSPVSVVITDRRGLIEYVNPTFCQMTGYSKEEAFGQNPRILKGDGTAPEVYRDLWQTILKGEQWIGELHNKRKNGEFFWESATISGVQTETGEVTHFLAVKEDITEKKELQAQLLQAQKLESVGQLAAGVAHEINTPIQFISDNLEFLKTSFQDLVKLSAIHKELLEKLKTEARNSDDVHTHEQAFEDADFNFLKDELPLAIDQSIDGTQRVSKIVRAMKEFSHPGTEEMNKVDLNRTIQTTITVTANEWKYVSKLETEFDSSLDQVPCLAGELNQVLLNMIINARDAIEETGKEGLIKIRTFSEQDQAVIQISDTGAGMPGEVQKRIFDPFYTTKEVGKGTGQGLSIAHNVIVKKHKGELLVMDSSPNGTTFEIRLPLEQEMTAETITL